MKTSPIPYDSTGSKATDHSIDLPTEIEKIKFWLTELEQLQRLASHELLGEDELRVEYYRRTLLLRRWLQNKKGRFN